MAVFQFAQLIFNVAMSIKLTKQAGIIVSNSMSDDLPCGRCCTTPPRTRS